MTSWRLTEDVVVQFLFMLPVKTLLRCRCVCKTWRTIIDNPNFITKHLNHANLNKTECILVKRFIQQSSKSVLSFVSEKTPDVTINIDVPFFTDKNLELLGPCNGIICLSWNGDILLCNPATREFKALPPCINNYLPGLLINELGVGFGFDQHSNDYKVVRIVELFYDDPFIHHDVKAELYKLSTDSWRPLNADVPYVWHQPCFTPFFNGSFHWYAQKDEFQYELILSFNMSTEVFEEIPLPSICSYPDGKARSLTILNKSLALILYVREEVDKFFDIWVMNEYGSKESWTKQFSIRPLSGIHCPLSFWRCDELLLQGING
ncbi:hypothetical protein LguiB_029078 [Lonicera macranthoides]